MKTLPKIKKYDRKASHSYSYGTYPTIDLLTYKPEKVLKVFLKQKSFESDGVDKIVELCEKNKIPYEVNDWVIDKVSVKENTYALGVFEKFDSPLEERSNHIVLVNPSNLGNIGTIIRSMVGFENINLAIIKPAVDIFDPLVIRSAMGAFFQIKFEYFDTFEHYQKKYSNRDLYPFMLDGAIDIKEIDFKSPYSLVFGNEGRGLDSSYKKVGQSVYIRHSEKIDSLNLSMAVGIALFNCYK